MLQPKAHTLSDQRKLKKLLGEHADGDAETLIVGVEMFVAETVAHALGVDADFAGEPECGGDVGKLDFAESDFGGLTSKADVGARGEKIGAETEDLVSVLVDPSDALNQDDNGAPIAADQFCGSSVSGPLGKSHNESMA